MAKRPESKFSNKLVTATKSKIHWTRIESWATPGVPDLHGVLPGLSFWVETKIVSLRSGQVRSLTTKQVGLRPHQIQWQMQYARHGGRVFNLVHRPHSSLLQLFPEATLSEEPMTPIFEADDDNAGLKMTIDYIIELGR